MPWNRSRPGGSKTAAKYRSPEHRRTRAAYANQLQREGFLICAQPVCVEPSRTIWPGTEWAAGHDDTGTRYIGPVHRTCNVRDGARRGAALVRNQRLAAMTTDGPACRYCRAPIDLGRTYCSQRCGYLGKADRDPPRPAPPEVRTPPRPFVPLQPARPGDCAICDQPTGDERQLYCGPECRAEGNGRNNRERYRARVGLPPTPDRTVTRRSSPLTW